MLKRVLLGGAAAAAVVFIAIQFVPVAARTNPPVEADLEAPPEVEAILRRSCYDCHSHETRWPWYNRVAPASWLVARDVEEGRKHVNFSRWGAIPAEARAEKLEEIWEEVDEGEMPLWFYVPLHPEAKLSAADLATLKSWTEEASRNARLARDVEKAASDLLKDAGKALEEAAEGIRRATERASKEAEDAQNEAAKSASGEN